MTTPSATAPIILPKTGVARVKSVLSGDTVVLLGKAASTQAAPPEVLFTLEALSAPRLTSKSNPVDEPGAFPAREWLRQLVVGKQVRFETRKQGASAGDRVYGWLYLDQPNGAAEPLHLAVECVRQGHATPKALKYNEGAAATTTTSTTPASEDDAANEAAQYEQALLAAYKEAKEAQRGIHAPTPLVRNVKNAGDDFVVLSLVQACQKLASKKQIQCVVEYVFDGSRFRCQVIDEQLGPDFQYANFTLLMAGASCPRLANTKTDTPAEPLSEQARQFVTARLLQRALKISLLGTDKSGGAAVGTINHPAGNIAVELLKNGLAKMTDWTVRLMPTPDVPALRFAENQAKRTLTGIWHSYVPPVLTTTTSQLTGTVVEVLSGDTLLVLPQGKDYTAESDLQKVSLASLRAPRMGRADGTRPDEPYAAECKDRLRVLTVGKLVQLEIHYERDIPMGENATEKRPFGTVSVGTKYPDVSETLVTEGLAITQRHRDDDPTSPRYDELRAAEAVAKAAKKGLHKDGVGGGSNNDDGNNNKKAAAPKAAARKSSVLDLTDPRKAKGYSGALMRAGNMKAVVDYVFNGALFKLLVPSENCYIRFAPSCVRCPQPSPSPGSRQQGKVAEPFGDESKRHARLHVLQRTVEITCTGVTNSGIVTGTLYFRPTAAGARVDYATDLLGAGLANLDARKVEYGEVPKSLLDVEQKARENKMGLWSLAPKVTADSTAGASTDAAKATEALVTLRLSEIRNGSHFFFHTVGDEAAKVVEDSMKVFTQNHGTAGAPCDAKVGKVVAALFDDGTGKSWYRARIVEKLSPTKVQVVFLDHGNVSTVPVATHLRPLDMSLGTERIPAVAKEASLALVSARSLQTDDGMDAARFLQATCWGRDVQARLLAPDDTGKLAVVLLSEKKEDDKTSDVPTINAQMLSEGLGRVVAGPIIGTVARGMADGGGSVQQLAQDFKKAQETARRSRAGMWRYGDVGDDDDEGPI